MDELRAQHICWVLGLLFPLFLLAGRHLGESLSICAPDYEVGQGGIGSLYTVLSLPSQVQLIGLTRFRLCRTPEQRGWWPEDSWSWPLSVPCHEDAFFAYSRFTHLGLSTSFALFFFFSAFELQHETEITLWFSASRQVWDGDRAAVPLVPSCWFCVNPLCKEFIGQLFGVSDEISEKSQPEPWAPLSR